LVDIACVVCDDLRGLTDAAKHKLRRQFAQNLVDVPVLLLVQLFLYVRFVEALDYVGRYEFDGNNMSVLDVGC